MKCEKCQGKGSAAMTDWRPFDTAPKGGPDILVYGQFQNPDNGGRETMIATWYPEYDGDSHSYPYPDRGEWMVADTQCGGHYPVTDMADYWMPLLEPPQ